MEEQVQKEDKKNIFKWILRVFKYRNYRLFFMGQGVSLIGNWMQHIAMSWLVYRLTNSGFLLGFVSFVGQIPSLFITPFSGVLADKHNRRNMLIIMQFLSMCQAIILAMLVLFKLISVPQIIILSAFLGIINAFDAPIRQSFTIDIIEKKEDLVNAIAMNSAMFNGARLVGPPIAGFIISITGEGICFLINALTYICVIYALFLMKLRPYEIRHKDSHILEKLKEGFKYSSGYMPIKYLLLLTMLVSLTGVPYVIFLPIFAKEVFHGGAQTLGFLMGGVGIGALCGAGFLASRKSNIKLWNTIALASWVFGIGVTCFSLSKKIELSLVLMALCGFGLMVQLATTNTVLQTIVEDDKRGRVMGFYILAFMGVTPFGNLIAGFFADRIGAPTTLFIGGILTLFSAFLFTMKVKQIKEFLKPFYERHEMKV